MSNPIKEKFLPVSVWYSGGKARAPMLSPITPESRDEWKRDLEQIKALGFNSVRTWVEWAHCEPVECEYHFENLELLCELAEEQNLRVLIQMYVDSAPDWVPQQFPEALFEAQSGEKVLPQSAPGCCVDHPGVAEAVSRFYTETARVAVKYPCFFGWDLWSEPHILNWAIIQYVPNAQFCFCASTRKRFRLWLQQKYGSLDKLNQVWYRNFHSWDQVEPPRFGTILSYTDFIDWKSFVYDKLAEDLAARRDAIRLADPDHLITSHAAVPSVFTSPFGGDGEADDFLMAKEMDYYGTSLYPKHSFPDRHWERWKLQLAIDFSRSANQANGGFYVGELQAGFGTRGVVVGDPVTAEDHRLWLWSAIAGGAKGINFFAYYPMASGYESGGYGLIHLDGKPTDRAKSSGQIAAAINRYQNLLLESRPVQARIALVYNPLAQMIGGEQNCGPTNGLRDSLVGYWRIFREANIPVDFIHRHELENTNLDRYQLIILPFPVMLTQKAADGLKRFIESGGCAAAEARLGWNDDRGLAADVIPGMGLHEVFGVRESRVKMEDRIEMKTLPVLHPLLAGIDPDSTLAGTFFAESFDVLGEAEILARFNDGSPAIAANRFGEGKTLFIGTFLGLGQHENPLHTNKKFFLNLIHWADISLPFTWTANHCDPDGVDLRLHNSPEGMLLFALNHTGEKKSFSVSIPVVEDATYSIQHLNREHQAQSKCESGDIVLNLQLDRQEVEILQIRIQD